MKQIRTKSSKSRRGSTRNPTRHCRNSTRTKKKRGKAHAGTEQQPGARIQELTKREEVRAAEEENGGIKYLKKLQRRTRESWPATEESSARRQRRRSKSLVARPPLSSVAATGAALGVYSREWQALTPVHSNEEGDEEDRATARAGPHPSSAPRAECLLVSLSSAICSFVRSSSMLPAVTSLFLWRQLDQALYWKRTPFAPITVFYRFSLAWTLGLLLEKVGGP